MYIAQWVQRREPGFGFDTVENAEGVFRSCSLGNECSSLASRRDPPHLNVNEKKKHRRRSVPGLCSNACPGHGRRRRRPCSSVWDAPVSCASGKRKHGPAYARAPQRSTLKEHVPRPGRILFAAAEEWERSPVRPWASAKYFTLLKWFKISGPNTPPLLV